MDRQTLKVSLLIERVKRFVDDFGPSYLYVLVSGGKDSIAAWAIVNDAIRDYVVVYIQIPGQTHADNLRTVYDVAEKLGIRDYGRVVVSRTREFMERFRVAIDSCKMPCLLHVVPFSHRGEDFWRAMRRYGYPAPLGRFGKGTRWCCGTFKHRVFNRLPYNGFRNGLPWRYGVDGSKATDSPYRRAIYTRDVMTWDKTRDTYLLLLRTLTDHEVWDILQYYGLKEMVWRQYEKWGRAPNCVFCPMLGKRKIKRVVESLTPSQRYWLIKNLRPLMNMYKPSTYSYRSIKTWLDFLEGCAGDDA